MRNFLKPILVASFLVGSATTVNSHAGATGIVLERMNSMVALGDLLKSLSEGTKDDATVSPSFLANAKEELQLHSGDNLLKQFPEGSLGKHSQASPQIWQDWAGFSELAEKLERQAEKLDTIKSNGSLKALLGEIGTTCSACHKVYRIKK